MWLIAYDLQMNQLTFTGAFFVTYHSTKLASVFRNIPSSHLYTYTCKRNIPTYNSTKDFAKQRYNTPYACDVI